MKKRTGRVAPLLPQPEGDGRPLRNLRPARWRGRALRAAALLLVLPAGCDRPAHWHSTDISGNLPVLSFTMTRAADRKTVTAADYRGKVTLLYFGYSFCPDVCPMTLSNVARVLREIGPRASDIRVLFVTVDPDRDTLAVLKPYAAAFGPQVDGLRGDPDQLAALARRYRVAYSVSPASPGHAYEVTHSSGIYAFDRLGRPRLLISTLSSARPDVTGTAEDLRALLK